MQPIKIGMIGYGGIGRVHAMAYRDIGFHYGLPAESIQIAGVATSRKETAQKAAVEIGCDFYSDDYRDLLKRNDIAIIDCCTPNNSHEEILIAAAQAGKLQLRVDTNGFADFDSTAPGPGGGIAFYVSGDICDDLVLLGSCAPVGTFHCWGWIRADGLGVVAQEYDLDGRGKIQVQGVEDDGPRAVTGGTGEFRNVRGEASGFDFSQFDSGPGEFIVNFNLIGTR